MEYKPELDIAFDEEDLADNPELAEMLEDFDAYIRRALHFVDKARERAERDMATALNRRWKLGGAWFLYQQL